MSEPHATLADIEGDAVEKVNAGAALVYALYTCSPDAIEALPSHVFEPLARAQSAYGVHKRHVEAHRV